MQTAQNNHTSNILHRITVAWSISECALGGFLHAIQSPFTGLLVGGLSVMFISLIAYHAEKPKSAILQSLIFVLGVKMAVSPHSPLGAYFAVASQAFLGILFFSIFKRFSIGAVFTAVSSLVLSALQKVVILTLLFGVTFWNAIDTFTAEVGKKLSFMQLNPDFSVSMWIIGLYIFIYAIGGLLIGLLAARIPQIFKNNAAEFDRVIAVFDHETTVSNTKPTTKKKWNIWYLILGFVILGVGMQWLIFSAESALHQLMRTFGIIVLWIFVFRPLFKWILQKTLQNKQGSIQMEIAQVQMRIPVLVEFAKYAWAKRGDATRNKLINFITIYVYFAVYKL